MRTGPAQLCDQGRIVLDKDVGDSGEEVSIPAGCTPRTLMPEKGLYAQTSGICPISRRRQHGPSSWHGHPGILDPGLFSVRASIDRLGAARRQGQDAGKGSGG
jgi:hypothetical protein